MFLGAFFCFFPTIHLASRMNGKPQLQPFVVDLTCHWLPPFVINLNYHWLPPNPAA